MNIAVGGAYRGVLAASDLRPHCRRMNELLDEVAVRVLGSLMEKELITPDNYPLTLKALTAACNQTSSRDPVMKLDETEVTRALERLAQQSLARGIHPSHGRVMRYRHEIGEKLHLHRPERALLSVLMLRGPQTPGELRTRTARAEEFVDPSHVEIVLDSLATLSTPLVTALSRRPGQKEVRYTHLLAGPVSSEDHGSVAADAPPSADPQPSSGPPEREEAPAGSGENGRVQALEQEVASLRDQFAELRSQFEAFRRQFE